MVIHTIIPMDQEEVGKLNMPIHPRTHTASTLTLVDRVGQVEQEAVEAVRVVVVEVVREVMDMVPSISSMMEGIVGTAVLPPRTTSKCINEHQLSRTSIRVIMVQAHKAEVLI